MISAISSTNSIKVDPKCEGFPFQFQNSPLVHVLFFSKLFIFKINIYLLLLLYIYIDY